MSFHIRAAPSSLLRVNPRMGDVPPLFNMPLPPDVLLSRDVAPLPDVVAHPIADGDTIALVRDLHT